ncbi:hypothetical protein J1N35_001529 [Gossypium stocksii]|uniref:Uncharacterized protein n=1 Tax=Gossypium stocksii TaxID=47602 RepID=A0A9D3WJP3_9ROSI|nr:hypothetical protein J1N35_001529 [Gossypium stocksii]
MEFSKIEVEEDLKEDTDEGGDNDDNEEDEDEEEETPIMPLNYEQAFQPVAHRRRAW